MTRPYKLIVTDDANTTLGEGQVRHFASMLGAANALVKHPAPYKQIIYDNGHHARELNDHEQRLLEHVCGLLGYDVEQVEGH
jgi:hypothetical protein